MRLLSRTLLTLAALLIASSVASATPISITGAATGSAAAATGELTLSANTLTLQITNASLYDGRITALGFDLRRGDVSATTNNGAGLQGYSGNNAAKFVFSDGALGNVPQFNQAGVVLDFGWALPGGTAKKPKLDFTSGSPNDGLAPSSTLTFIATGDFLGLTEAQVASALFVRFQQIGIDGEDSDVGTTSVPEPASLLLFGTGLFAAVAARRRKIAQR
jgi:hypothetical protein